MSKTDRIKEELGWLKIVFGICVAIDVSLVGWLAQNYDRTSSVLIIFGFIAVVILTVVVVWVNRAAMKRFKEFGGRVMVWFVVAALVVLLIGLAIVVHDIDGLHH